MCEFCMQHGEGKQWYLQMKNYSEALLYEPLTEEQQAVSGEPTRHTWLTGFMREFVLPATGVVPPPQEDDEGQASITPISDEERLRRRQIVHFGQVIPIEDVERIIDQVDSITRLPCGCRYETTGKSNCRYCFGIAVERFGILSEFLDPKYSLESVQKDQAKSIIRKFDKEGLIHSVWTGVSPYVVGLCNCDHDCGAYRGYIEQRGTPSFFRAEYISMVDWDVCRGCKLCIQQCQFGAMFYSSAQEKVYIDPRRCFGCGVCRTACNKDAIRLIPRERHPEVADLWLRERPV
jgi:ferredoxin